LVADFPSNGVLKIRALAIDIPVYLCLATTLGTQLASKEKGWELSAWLISACFLGGTAMGYLVFMNRERRFSYPMRIVSRSPLVLQAADWPQQLVVEGEKVKQALENSPAVTVATSVVTDYGCRRTSVVSTVDGIDVRNDPAASWVWRTPPGLPSPVSGPGFENHTLPWCRAKDGWDWLSLSSPPSNP
jgi:hypothetical protein